MVSSLLLQVRLDGWKRLGRARRTMVLSETQPRDGRTRQAGL